MDFSVSEKAKVLRGRLRLFMEAEVLPLESALAEEEIAPEILAALREKARAAGLFLPHLPQEWGGLGLGLLDLCTLFEEAGQSLLGPLALNCSAPDEGNMHLLLLAGTAEQKERYLRPLAQGTCRSAFAMTEPAPGAGSDPSMMRTVARAKGSGFVIDGHKSFATGADGAGFLIVAAVTDAPAGGRKACTLFLVEGGQPGLRVVRRIPVMGTPGPGGHCELLLESVEVPQTAVLGRVGDGLPLMQARLGPARLTHCMRWLGAARRALTLATERARTRESFGKTLGEHQGVQWMLADSATDLHASRLMTLEAAWRLETGVEARAEVSMCKVFVAEAVERVIDRALQVCGSLGYSADLPLERFYRDARAFRIYDGPSEVHRGVIARELLRRGPRAPAGS